MREASAAPFHDWNERIAAESYRPNAFARVFDEWDRVVAIVNNYEHLSFDVGPTLLPWLERHDPQTYERIIDADRRGGGGMAQAFIHLILPLADERDARTQIRWGLADFAHRFGRPATGLWLPECAVDERTLAVMAEEGVQFTVLAPGQAARWRPLDGDGDWTEGAIDTRRPYRWRHPDDAALGLDIVIYDGGVSHAAAFEMATMTSQSFLDRVQAAAGDVDNGLVTVAADGETFGHHQKFGDRLLAHALTVEAPSRGVRVTTVAEYLTDTRPEQQVQVHESSWSCAHGVGRWRDDCGCSTGGQPGWNQRWREPLRNALDHLHQRAAEVFERRAPAVLRDPWVARDAYVSVLIGASGREDFAAAHVVGDPVEAFTLLEVQRHAMAMYTSCGWFFHDVAGLETVQVLRYAARLVDLLDELGEDPDLATFLDILEKAESNDSTEGNGRDIWARHVMPSRVPAERVVAHAALVELLEQKGPATTLGGYRIAVAHHDHACRGAVALCSGQVDLEHIRTGRRTRHVYAALHLGGLEVLGATRPADDRRDGEDLAGLHAAFASGASVAQLIGQLIASFGPDEFDLGSALPDAGEQILQSAAQRLSDRFAAAYTRLFEDHRPTLESLAAAGYPLPPVLRAPAELALARRFEREVLEAIAAGATNARDYLGALEAAREARASGVALSTPTASKALEDLLLRALGPAGSPMDDGQLATAIGVVNLIHDLGVPVATDRAQERVYDALRADRVTPALRLLAASLGLAQ